MYAEIKVSWWVAGFLCGIALAVAAFYAYVTTPKRVQVQPKPDIDLVEKRKPGA